MVLAQTPTQALLIMVFGMLCWGLWAGMYKLAGKWRFELFYFDVAFGAAFAAIVYSLTMGSLGFDGFSFIDDLMHSAKRQWLMAFAAGAVFNLGNMIMMAAASVAGLSIALPLGLGVSLMIGAGLGLILHNAGANPLLLFAGSACLLIAVGAIAVAYVHLISARQDQLVKAGKVTTTSSAPGSGRGRIVSANAPSAIKGLLLGIISGLLIWMMLPLVQRARMADGMGPYSLMAVFAAGLLFSTLVFNNFFINLPVAGEPLEIVDYFRGSLRAHLVGLAAGVVLCTGILAMLVAQAGAPETLRSPATFYMLQQSAVLVGALCGIFLWNDFGDGHSRVRAIVWTFILLYSVGLVSIGLAGKFATGA
jgi:glucose uptake protein